MADPEDILLVDVEDFGLPSSAAGLGFANRDPEKDGKITRIVLAGARFFTFVFRHFTYEGSKAKVVFVFST